MKALILIAILLSNQVFASCDWSSISKVEGGYLYSEVCHVEAGKKVKGFYLLEKENKELRSTIELKDLAIQKQTERADMWMDTSFKVEEKLNSYERWRSLDAYKNVALGVGATVLAIWAAGQLRK